MIRASLLALAAGCLTAAVPAKAVFVPTAAPAIQPTADWELLVNGDFETNTMVGWMQNNGLGVAQWQNRAAPVGTPTIGPAEGDVFATPLTSGGHALNSSVSLWQTVALPENTTGRFVASFDGYAAHDELNVVVDWLADVNGTLEFVRSDAVGSIGGQPGIYDGHLSSELFAPSIATHARFRAVATLRDGNWYDVAIDNASLLSTVSVPEPAMAMLLGVGAMVALRRRPAAQA